MDPQQLQPPKPHPWNSERDPGSGTVETLNKFLGSTVRKTWDDLDRALRITESTPDFSGILPLGDPSLEPYLNKPGVFLILGPQPSLPVLHIGASRGPVGLVIQSRLEKQADGGFVWRWEKRSTPSPTFAAIATMEEYWAFAPPLRNLLAKRLGADPESANLEDDPPLV